LLYSNQAKYLYVIGNSLRSKFLKCFTRIKNMLFRAHCCALYASQLRCSYSYESYDGFECLTMTLPAVFIIFLVIAVYVNIKKMPVLILLMSSFALSLYGSLSHHSVAFGRSKYVGRFLDLLRGWFRRSLFLSSCSL